MYSSGQRGLAGQQPQMQYNSFHSNTNGLNTNQMNIPLQGSNQYSNQQLGQQPLMGQMNFINNNNGSSNGVNFNNKGGMMVNGSNLSNRFNNSNKNNFQGQQQQQILFSGQNNNVSLLGPGPNLGPIPNQTSLSINNGICNQTSSLMSLRNSNSNNNNYLNNGIISHFNNGNTNKNNDLMINNGNNGIQLVDNNYMGNNVNNNNNNNLLSHNNGNDNSLLGTPLLSNPSLSSSLLNVPLLQQQNQQRNYQTNNFTNKNSTNIQNRISQNNNSNQINKNKYSNQNNGKNNDISVNNSNNKQILLNPMKRSDSTPIKNNKKISTQVNVEKNDGSKSIKDEAYAQKLKNCMEANKRNIYGDNTPKKTKITPKEEDLNSNNLKRSMEVAEIVENIDINNIEETDSTDCLMLSTEKNVLTNEIEHEKVCTIDISDDALKQINDALKQVQDNKSIVQPMESSSSSTSIKGKINGQNTKEPSINNGQIIVPVNGILNGINNENESFQLEGLYCKTCLWVIRNDENSRKQHILTVAHRNSIKKMEQSNNETEKK